MAVTSRKEHIVLFIGDILFLYASLFLMLYISYLGLPEENLLREHLVSFSIIFLVWTLVFFIAGLYEKHTIIFKNKLPSVILNTQMVNTFLAVLFFYLIPFFAITPKTNLFIYLIISFGLILIWRIYLYPKLGSRNKENALIIGSGNEMKELINEINNNSIYNFFFKSTIDLDEEYLKNHITETVKRENISLIIVDFENKKIQDLLPELYTLMYSQVRFVDKHKVYEDVFDKIPLSLLGYDWFLENISFSPKPVFDVIKRLIDLTISIVLSILSLIILPFVILAIKFESIDGPTMIIQERVGRNNKSIKIYKFRTMERDDKGSSLKGSTNKVTKVGVFLRRTRIDELPQLWNVLKGDISLIGPRPELPVLAKEYNNEVPYYNIRHLIKPGLSGWAQIYHENHPHHGTDVEETKNKLSYDIYYIKNRSIMLDIKIALKTIKTILSRSGV